MSTSSDHNKLTYNKKNMKAQEFKKLIREEVKKILEEKSADEIQADKESITAQIAGAKAKLKAAQLAVKVAQGKIAMLNKKKQEIAAER
jgi:hypothetical protein